MSEVFRKKTWNLSKYRFAEHFGRRMEKGKARQEASWVGIIIIQTRLFVWNSWKFILILRYDSSFLRIYTAGIPTFLPGHRNATGRAVPPDQQCWGRFFTLRATGAFNCFRRLAISAFIFRISAASVSTYFSRERTCFSVRPLGGVAPPTDGR